MAFTMYLSGDVNGPGPLKGTVGDLLRVLDACLVDGYTGRAAAGWSKPIANSGNIGSYKPGAGTQHTLVINDNGPNGTSTYKEAWAAGWKNLVTLGTVGTGQGQFPLPGQILGYTTGRLVWRKSTTADTTPRHWMIFADSRTMYMFIFAGDASYTTTWTGYGFGDFYSLDPASTGNCFLFGNKSENTAPSGAATENGFGWARPYNQTPDNTGSACFAAGLSGVGAPRRLGFQGDSTYQADTNGNTAGRCTLNDLNGGFQFSPFEVSGKHHNASSAPFVDPIVYGRLRGVWFAANTLATCFQTGQITNGTGALAGKQFYAIKPVNTQADTILQIEISDTLETN
jgi:hypothetical protein